MVPESLVNSLMVRGPQQGPPSQDQTCPPFRLQILKPQSFATATLKAGSTALLIPVGSSSHVKVLHTVKLPTDDPDGVCARRPAPGPTGKRQQHTGCVGELPVDGWLSGYPDQLAVPKSAVKYSPCGLALWMLTVVSAEWCRLTGGPNSKHPPSQASLLPFRKPWRLSIVHGLKLSI